MFDENLGPNWDTFGKVSMRGLGPKRERKDLSNGEAMMYVLPQNKENSPKTILFSPAAATILGVEESSTETEHLTWNYVGNVGKMFLRVPVAHKDSISTQFQIRHTDKDYMGITIRNAKVWDTLRKGFENNNDDIIAFNLTEGAFHNFPCVNFTHGHVFSTLAENLEEATAELDTPLDNIPEIPEHTAGDSVQEQVTSNF